MLGECRATPSLLSIQTKKLLDPIGTVLPDDIAAAEYAERLLTGLRAERPPELPLTIIVNKRPN